MTTTIETRVPQTGNTFYGDSIVSIKEIASEPQLEHAVNVGLQSIFGNIGLSQEQVSATIDYCITTAKNDSDLLKYETLVHEFLLQHGVLEQYNAAKKDRAAMRVEKVKKYITGKSVLDLGCGSGKIGTMISQDGFEVTLADVYRNPNIDLLNLPFHQIIDGQTLPFENNSFDNVLVLSMLHHTQNPLFTLEECKRILKKDGRLNLIETVYGIPEETETGSYRTDDSFFKSLPREQQRKICSFFDYFGNHVLDGYTTDPEKYIPVPFNFTTPDGLEKILSQKGFALLSKEYLGIYPFSYNYHVHFVYSK